MDPFRSILIVLPDRQNSCRSTMAGRENGQRGGTETGDQREHRQSRRWHIQPTDTLRDSDSRPTG